MSVPRTLRLQEQGKSLLVEFAADRSYRFSAEFLRVFSPSAEVQGHGLAEPQLLGGKSEVRIVRIEPVGRYAVRLHFSDGHDSGLYAWDAFERFGQQQQALWARYLERLELQGMSRTAEENIVPLAVLRPKNALQR